MNIANKELIDIIAHYPNLFALRPVIPKTGFLAPIENTRSILYDVNVLPLIAQEFSHLLQWEGIDMIVGIELMGVTLAMALAYEHKLPLAIVREQAKRAGRPLILGADNVARPARCILVDDMMSYGGTKQRCVEILRQHGIETSAVACFMNFPPNQKEAGRVAGYSYGAREWLQEQGIPVATLIDWLEEAKIQHEAGRLSDEEFAIMDRFLQEPWIFNDDTGGWLTRVVKLYQSKKVAMPEFFVEYCTARGVETGNRQ